MPLIWAGAVLLGGCTSLTPQTAQSPLRRPQMSPDSVVLDVLFVRCPLGDPEINMLLWSEADEQQFPPVLRQQLAQNGFRAGIVSGQIPAPLAKLAKLGDASATSGGDWQTITPDEMENEPTVVGHHLPARAGGRNDVVVSEVYPELPVLTYEGGVAGGSRYPNAQGLFVMKAFPQSDGRVRLDLVPELQYGAIHQQYIANDNGVMQIKSDKHHRVFDSLTVSTVLSPGQLLVITSIPTRPGSLGHQFFTCQEGGKRQQKLLLIRLAQTQQQGLFSPSEPLNLSQSDR